MGRDDKRARLADIERLSTPHLGQPALDQLRCELYIQGPNRTRGSGSSADVPKHLGRVPPAEAMRRSLLGIL